MNKNITLDIEELNKAPQTIGVYEFLGKKDSLYIGKAVNIKARLASHRQNTKYSSKEAKIFEKARKVKIIPADSEFKALLLEAKLIKEKRPKYNKLWKDDKSHLYIEVTKEEYPKVLLARKTDIEAQPKTKSQFFGPFQSKKVAQELIREIRKVVPFSTRKNMGKKPCFHSKIGLCDPCPNKVEKNEDKKEKELLKKKYRKNIKQVVKILSGETDPVVADLKTQMEETSKEKNYEEALTLRNRLFRFEKLISQTLGIKEDILPQKDTKKALESLLELLESYFPNLKKLDRIEAYDVSNIGQKQATASMVVLTKGRVDKSQYRKFKIKGNQKSIEKLGDTGMLSQVVKRRFKNDWPHPNLIVVDGGKPQVRAVMKALEKADVEVPTVGIAKAPDRLIIGSDNIPTKRLPQNHPGFNLIRLIRDESHRFSRKYHLFLRGKKLIP